MTSLSGEMCQRFSGEKKRLLILVPKKGHATPYNTHTYRKEKQNKWQPRTFAEKKEKQKEKEEEDIA